MSRRGRNSSGPRQPGGGRQEAGPRGRGHGRDRDERTKERFKEHSNLRQSDRRGKHLAKRDRPVRHPEVRAAKAASLEGRRPAPSSFEARKERAPQDDGPKAQFSAGVQTVTVTPDENNMRVDRFFEARFPGLSFSHIQRIIRKGEVRVNGKRTQPKARLEGGQAVRIPPLQLAPPAPRDDAPQAQKD